MQGGMSRRLLLYFFFRLSQPALFIFFLISEDLLLFFFLFIFLGNNDELDRVDLRHLELDIAFRAAQNFAFFDFVFVQVELSVAFRALNHGRFLLPDGPWTSGRII
jgi:hypothetical protein